jgi:hypothetical protein
MLTCQQGAKVTAQKVAKSSYSHKQRGIRIMYRSFLLIALGSVSLASSLNAACCGQGGNGERSQPRMYRTSARGVQQRTDHKTTDARNYQRDGVQARDGVRARGIQENRGEEKIDYRRPTSFPVGYAPPGGNYTNPPRAN